MLPIVVEFSKGWSSVSKQKSDSLRIIEITQGTGWYLVKKPEGFGELINRIFFAPNKVDIDAMIANNTHLGNVSMMTMLQVGQVVIIAQSSDRNNTKLRKMKEEAIEAQRKWQQHSSLMMSSDPTDTFLLDLFSLGGRLVTWGKNEATEVYQDMSKNISQGQYFDIGTDYLKPIKDAYGSYKDTILKIHLKSYETLIKEAEKELSKITTAKGMGKRSVSSVYHSKSPLVQKAITLFDGTRVGKNLFTKETGILTDSTKGMIKAEAQARHAVANGGIKKVSLGLDSVSKARGALRTAAVFGVVVDIGLTSYKSYQKYEQGDTHGAKVEAARGAAGTAGGLIAGGGAYFALTLIFGVATGGVGLVLMGAVVAGASYAGGKLMENAVNNKWNGGRDD